MPDEDDARASLVVAKCQELYQQFSSQDPSVRACVVVLASLPIETNNLKYMKEEVIQGWGYNVSVGYQGSWIRNNGSRGFANWCVIGFNHQADNIIYID